MKYMQRLMFYLRYALRSLRRDGTRTFLAGLSVAFGVLSLVAMQLFAYAWLHGAMFDQRLQYGGDAVIQSQNPGQGFTDSDLAQIKTWQEQGLIADYSLLSNGSAAYLRTPSNGRVTFLRDAFGIDVTTYPLTGRLILREPAGASAADILQHPTDALVTHDLAERRGLRLGDSVLLSGDSAPIQLMVAGIVDATPTQQGDSVFYSLETARLIENREDVINRISINWGTAPNAEQSIIDSPYDVFVAFSHEGAVQSSSGQDLFDLMLTGSGVLGLLVGGLSVSNTLQVILARRKLEIAMLKTLGYRQADLMILISLETGLIGLVGGLVGTLLGTQLARKLVDLLASASSIMVDWNPNPVIVVGGIVVGVLTAVVFGMQAILVSSATRPVQLLRELPPSVSRSTQISRLGLYVLMLLVFGLLVGVVLGSPLEGILYVIVGGILIVIVRALFWAVLWITLKLPLPLVPMLRLARANLRQKKMQASLIVLALTAGAFSVSFAALIICNVQSTLTRVRDSDEGYNLMVYTTSEGSADAVHEMVSQGADATYITEQVTGTLNGAAITIESRDAADLNSDMHYSGDWSDDENIALLPEDTANRYTVGDTLTLNISGQEQSVRLAGFYTVDSNPMSFQAAPLIVPRQLLQRFADIPLQTRVFGKFPVDSLRQVTTTLGQALPEMVVFSRADLNDALIAQLQAFFTCAVSVAGLAFVAGGVLIANAAGLNIVERYREIGIFKAVGYTSGHVLRAFLSEYGFLGALAGLFGISGAALAIILINILWPIAQLVIEPTILVGMLVFSVAIALLSAAIIAWQPTRVRPLDVLRYE
jgi:putative ABC transport system permease protein